MFDSTWRRWSWRAGTASALAVALFAVGSPAGAQETVDLADVFNPLVVKALQGADISTELTPLGLSSDDPWFDEPEIEPGTAPGTLLKARPVSVQVYQVRPDVVSAHQLMYTTTDHFGRQMISTGILMIPEDGTAPGDRKIIGYAEANDSLGANCAPSHQWTGGNQSDPAMFSALGPVAQMFGHGWAVMMSDVGNDGDTAPHPFSIGQFSGKATLDGVRAALALPEGGLESDTPVGIYGVAGGGVAAGFAAEQAHDYAPELNVQASAIQAMMIDPATFEETAAGGIGSGFVFSSILGFDAGYPDVRLDDHLTPIGHNVAAAFRASCQALYLGLPFVPFDVLLTNPSPRTIPALAAAYADNTLGKQAPASKLLISSCEDDFLVPFSEAEQLAQTYRADGGNVDLLPSQCGPLDYVTNLYKTVTDQLGMQDIAWLAKTFDEAEGR